jgi:hypothetical protein
MREFLTAIRMADSASSLSNTGRLIRLVYRRERRALWKNKRGGNWFWVWVCKLSAVRLSG